MNPYYYEQEYQHLSGMHHGGYEQRITPSSAMNMFFPGPPGGPPGFPSSPPPAFPGSQGQGSGAPTAPPPSFTPQQSQTSAFAVDPGGIRGCMFRNTYVWLNNGRGFWFFPTFVGRDSVAGYRWRGFRWVYYGTDLRRIRSFQCF